ncbi:nitroimidazol reductase NimA-like FMN-containing flavoprotein (pyridoxamine 5'-phosphate oxidase superfamily) [Rhodococcus sp. LBL1]|nr:nitroimidazol reductase NimA-like FMN-containing flavoprotein (pyridoxamine 5'-phosphate oxidase superfamily) [Rhodococcus sp. LBL1]MDH6685694.1 nitroimidazol reductase NimA-like FMN-containing flavoprotein (pyridoxamine 5'-phosphate oxidase superfamily) [Rhodococcus sp. LBL2]
MTAQLPTAELDRRYSAETAPASTWAQVTAALDAAEVYWLSTVRSDGRPHVTPLIAVRVDDRLHFCTGPDEQKARNLAAADACVLTTGSNALGSGLDVVIEGRAVRVSDPESLIRVADAYRAKYGQDWNFRVEDGRFVNTVGGPASVFRIEPGTVFAFAKGEYAQTRWRF